MKKNVLNFLKKIKNKSGEAIDAIIITPIWLLLLSYIGTQMQIRQAKQNLADSVQVVSRYLMLSDTLDEGLNTVNNYIKQRKDKNSFDEFTIKNITKIYAKQSNGSGYTFTENSNASTFSENWKKGNMVEITLTRKTPFSGNSVFKICAINNDDICYSIVSESVSARTTFFILGEV